MPLPFEFEGKGVVLLQDFAVNPFVNKKRKKKYINEPTSVLDSINTIPSPPASTSTLSSSLGGGDTAGVAAFSSKWPPPENQETSTSNAGVVDVHQFQQPSLDEKCVGMVDWETGESGQDQAMLRWIMGDVEDPSMGLNKVLHGNGGGGGGGAVDFEFNGGFGVVDQGFSIGLDSGNQIVNLSQISNKFTNDKTGLSTNPQLPPSPPQAMFSNHHHHHHSQNQIFSPLNEPQMLPFDIKPQMFNPQLLINQSQPFEHQLLMPPQPKRHNPGSIEIPKNPFLDSGQNPLQLLQKSPSMKKMAAINEVGLGNQNHHHHQQQGIIDQLFKAADLIQSGNNPILAQGILARLNHQLSPIGKPFDRAAFYFKEALQLLLHSILNNIHPQITPTASPFSLIFKIGAYKSFSEISPFLQFANFTCNQALLESLNGFDQIHIIDFDIGYGGQWASLMQELALRNNGVSSLKITAFASPSTHDQLELGLTRENLIHFASEIRVGFDFEIVNIDVLASSSWSLPFHVSDTEAIAVNLPIHVFSNHQTQIPSVLRFVKNLSPKIVVSVDRGCDRTDLPFSNHLIHALQSYSNLLESLNAVNMNLDSLQKIERFLVQPAIEKIVLGRYLFPEKTQHWRTLFLSAGFSPLLFSNFTESQAECLVKRTPVRDFHVEKRQSLLVLCWQRRELVSASAWRC
ncbi:Transcription factor GRAS [Cynara cardunculus var. scolymus]|uniref:Transcription factor GRAS n=2 Tax=Cynara cardunculus var. scolymus TaxID=59895 RepID=A0A124SB14_CYNCS|nr:Transcription factor GRAS [Cynara cardunculus var. scolymus]